MPVTINGDGSITGLSVGGLGSGVVNTATLADGAASGSKLTMPSGSVIQTVQSIKTTTQSYSTGSSTLSDSYFDITGLSVSITPSSGTKCFVSYTVNVGGQAGYGQGLALFRDSTQIYLGDASGSIQRLSNFDYSSGNDKVDSMAGQFLDTHGANGSTSVTYKLQMYVATPGWTSRVNRSQSTADTRSWGRGASSITVMEIAA